MPFDKFGTINRKHGLYVDLTTMDAVFLLTDHRSGIHTYYGMSAPYGSPLRLSGYTVLPQNFVSVHAIELFLQGSGIHIVLYAEVANGMYTLYSKSFHWTSFASLYPVDHPLKMTDHLIAQEYPQGAQLEHGACALPTEAISHYPHKCNRCGGPAYIGFSNMDCRNKCSA